MTATYRFHIAERDQVFRFGFEQDQAKAFGMDTAITLVNGNTYDGPYEVTPRAHNEVILPTRDLFMADDVTVRRVPYYETSNLFDGKTAYIAEEI